jgi:hypothetical protein
MAAKDALHPAQFERAAAGGRLCVKGHEDPLPLFMRRSKTSARAVRLGPAQYIPSPPLIWMISPDRKLDRSDAR